MKLRIPDKMHLEVIPGILEQDWESIERKIEMVKPFAQSIHIDLLDGVFAPNKTWLDPKPFSKYKNDLILEVHMMVDDPVKYIDPFAEAGFSRFIGQIEKMPDVVDFVAKAEMNGEVGLAIDSETPVEKITIPLEDLDFVFVMTVKAGFSHQSFLPEMLEKVKALRSKDEWIPIEVDGGINDQTIIDARAAGATRFVSTGYLFRHPNLKDGYKTLCNNIKQY